MVAEITNVRPSDPIAPSPPPPRQVRASTRTERALTTLLSEFLQVEHLTPDSNFFDDLGADSMVVARFCARLRKQTDLPSVSVKDVYQHPTISSLAAALAPPGSAPVEDVLVEVLADLLQLEQVPADSDVFEDLGADSMVVARFCARLRKRTDLPSVSVKDVYQHRTISSLANALATDVPADGPTTVAEKPATRTTEPARRARTGEYLLCGALQLLLYLIYSSAGIVVVIRGYEWVAAGHTLLDEYLRSVVFGAAALVVLATFPILAKWVLIGRWKPKQIRVWSLGYLRFWIVKTLIRSNPLVLLTGGRSHTSTSSPLHVLYLKALGAKIGRGVAIYSRHVPVCTDLLSIGDGAVVRKDALINCYRAHDGMIQTGAVTLGTDAFVGEATVIDIDSSLGDGSQLGHSSSLHNGQNVPDGECWQGSPAQRTDLDYRTLPAARCGTIRRSAFGLAQILVAVLVTMPLAVGALAMLFFVAPWLAELLEPGPLLLAGQPFYQNAALYQNALITSAVLFGGFVIVGLLVIVTVPRLLNLFMKPERVYPLYGFHYKIHRTIARLTNGRFFAFLFGDSSYIVNFLRCLGYDLSQAEQTGSNFGLLVKHETPFLVSVGRGTMVADGLSIANADFSNTSFRLSETAIGAHNFLGNYLVYPAQGRTGDNCLLATKVAVPVEGRVRKDVGLLGSPSFEIPRTVARDARLSRLGNRTEFRRGLAAKNRHNIVTMALYLLVRWFYVFLFTLISAAALELYSVWDAPAVALLNVVLLVVSVAYWVPIERSVAVLQALRPMGCSIYERPFWRHERFWKVPAMTYIQFFNGTPFKNLIWRLLGVRIGKRVFDDGCSIAEKTFVTIGNECTLNAGSIIQCHSQEDGAFKSDRVTIGSRCTLGVGAFVHYGTALGDGSVLVANSFLMKGEDVPPNSQWAGNPARETPDAQEPRGKRGGTA